MSGWLNQLRLLLSIIRTSEKTKVLKTVQKQIIMNLKTIFAAAAVLTLSTGAMTAQNPVNNPKNEARAGVEARKGENPQKRDAVSPFSSLNLTDAQKSQIKELGTKMQTQRKERGEQQRAQRSNSRKEYLAGLKTILTPQQYTQFLEDNFVKAGSRNGRKADRSRAGKNRMDKNMKPGERKAPQTAATAG